MKSLGSEYSPKYTEFFQSALATNNIYSIYSIIRNMGQLFERLSMYVKRTGRRVYNFSNITAKPPPGAHFCVKRLFEFTVFCVMTYACGLVSKCASGASA